MGIVKHTTKYSLSIDFFFIIIHLYMSVTMKILLLCMLEEVYASYLNIEMCIKEEGIKKILFYLKVIYTLY